MDLNGGFEAEEVLSEILKRLSVKSLLRFMCVSKPWNHLITDPFFVAIHRKFDKQSHSVLGITIRRGYCGKLHHQQLECFRVHKTNGTTLEHLKIEYPWKSRLNQDKDGGHVEVIGHCHGLICARAYETTVVSENTNTSGTEPKYTKIERYVICNPITRTFHILPVSDIEVPDLEFEVDEYLFQHVRLEKLRASGFGFIDDHVYKVVVVTYGMAQVCCGDFEINIKHYKPLWLEVYDSRSGSWRRVDVDLDFSYYDLFPGTFNCFDKCLYFLGRGYGKKKRYFTIVSFDLAKEKWNETLLPYKSSLPGDYDHYDGENEDQYHVDDVFGQYSYCQGVNVLGESAVVLVGDQRNVCVRSVWKMNKGKDKVSWTHLYRFNFKGSTIGFCGNGELLLTVQTLGEKHWKKLVLYADSNKINEDSFGFTDLDFKVNVIVPDFVESLVLLDGERQGIEDASDNISIEQEGNCDS